ncbi:uncharacterized protein P884DRAFT_275580 [Thermothelomyces heterothallicus CBS 202.75]|uniref:uncharacterized protein n=1 Tax=Thermothelomyces heterothallicus CBS 202.75 TaxID=1149848 RepID=UPI003743B29A
MEDDANQDTDDDDDDDNDDDGDEHMLTNQVPETPTKKKTGRVVGKRTKAGPGRKDNETTAGPAVMDEFVNFPAVLPESVIEREAILVNNNGVWTVSPVPIDVHAQWLARLPASLQTRFYLQAHSTTTAAPTAGIAYSSHGNNVTGEGNTANAGFILPHAIAPAGARENEEEEEEEEEEEVDDAANNTAAEHQERLSSLPGMEPMDLGGYDSAAAAAAAAAAVVGGCGGVGPDTVDLHSIPWHPGFFAEQMARRDEERDRAVLFGGGDGHDQDEDGVEGHDGY